MDGQEAIREIFEDRVWNEARLMRSMRSINASCTNASGDLCNFMDFQVSKIAVFGRPVNGMDAAKDRHRARVDAWSIQSIPSI